LSSISNIFPVLEAPGGTPGLGQVFPAVVRNTKHKISQKRTTNVYLGGRGVYVRVDSLVSLNRGKWTCFTSYPKRFFSSELVGQMFSTNISSNLTQPKAHSVKKRRRSHWKHWFTKALNH